MNPLGNGNLGNGLSPELMQNIQQVKNMMKMFNGNPNAMLQQMGQNNPMLNQVMQMCKGQNPENVFKSMCKAKGIDPEQILNQFRN